MNYEDRVTKEYVEGLLGAMPKVASGSYEGTGEDGATITFPFVPKLVFISGERLAFGLIDSGSVRIIGTNSSGSVSGKHIGCTMNGLTFSLHTNEATYHMNSRGVNYVYLILA